MKKLLNLLKIKRTPTKEEMVQILLDHTGFAFVDKDGSNISHSHSLYKLKVAEMLHETGLHTNSLLLKKTLLNYEKSKNNTAGDTRCS